MTRPPPPASRPPRSARRASWKRRSRGGFGWLDGVEAPLGEASEAYLIQLGAAGAIVRTVTVTAPSWRYDAASRVADGTVAGVTVSVSVAQLGGTAGAPAIATFVLT